MPSQVRIAGAGATLSNAGTSENAEAWVSPGNVTADDGTTASITAATYDSPDISQLLVASSFGFAIPSGATITGIIVEIDRNNAAGAASDNRVQLSTSTAFAGLVGDNKADTATDWPASLAIATYGTSSDHWNAGLDASEVNASGFSVMLSVQADAANTDIAVDFIRVTVHYTHGTQIFMRDAVAGTHRADNTAKLNSATSGWIVKALATTRGDGVNTKATNTAGGATEGVEVTDSAGGFPLEWISDPLNADVTITGDIAFCLWAHESNASANVAINAQVDILRSDGSITTVVKTARTTELGLTSARADFLAAAADYTEQTANKGDRLRIRVFGDDAGTMASGFTFTFSYDASSENADGDSYVVFAESLSFITSAPSGSTYYFRKDDVSAFDTVSVTDWATPGTVTTLDRGGTNDWSGTGNVAASDDTYASVSLATVGSDALMCRNFGLALPAGSIVRGVEIEVEGHTDTGTRGVAYLLLPSNGGNEMGYQHSFDLTTGADQAVTDGGQEFYHGAVNVPDTPAGLASLLESDVEDADFGVRLHAGAAADTLYIDRVRMRLHYSSNPRRLQLTTGRGAASFEVGHAASPNGWHTGSAIGYQPSFGGAEGDALRGGSVVWVSPALEAFTLTGLVRCNLRIYQANANGNNSVRVDIAKLSSDGATRTAWASGWAAPSVGGTSSTGELGTSDAVCQVDVAGDDLSVSSGERIEVTIRTDDSSDINIQNLQRVFFSLDGPSASAAGDSYVTFTQTLTEFSSTPVPRHPGIDHMNPGLLMKAYDAWEHRRGMRVPRLWTPEGATI